MSLTLRANETSREPSLFDDDARWKAVKRRDRAADGTFVYSCLLYTSDAADFGWRAYL